MPKVLQVIQSEITRGKGVEGDPLYTVTQYHAFDGTFLAENDNRSGWASLCFDGSKPYYWESTGVYCTGGDSSKSVGK